MAKRKAKTPETKEGIPKSRPALSQEAKENMLIGLAMDLVEQRLRDGTATSQEVCHFLKLGSTRERIEKDTLKNKNKLMEAQVENLQTAKNIEELYKDAISSFQRYGGHYNEDDE